MRLTNSCQKGKHILRNLQLEKGTVATPYEPHKSNILSCLEPVELGGVESVVGSVKDTLNVLTGEVIQRTDVRPYDTEDEFNPNVATDMTNTRYILSKPIVKTVFLSVEDQDGKDTHLKSYDGTTHINTSSEGLNPIFEGFVATKL